MAAKTTVPILVHGANQTAKERTEIPYEDRNLSARDEALACAPDVLSCLKGERTDDIAKRHTKKDPAADYPEYFFRGAAKHSIWYGGVWEKYCWDEVPDGDGAFTYKEPRAGALQDQYGLGDKLYASRPKGIKLGVLATERGVMDKCFAELVPFYELRTVVATGTTLYSEICEAFLDDLVTLTDQGTLDYVLIAHSMGCAVSYNVMSHLSLVIAGQKPHNPALKGVLSPSYEKKLKAFAKKPAQCLGMLTFANYTGFNYAQALNHHVLFGGFKKLYPYPDAVLCWRNFFTFLGGDLYILDDTLRKTITGPNKKRFKDERVWRIPFTNIGHGRENWFKRNDFEDDMKDVLLKDLTFSP